MMKEWKNPEVKDLSVSMTASGSSASTSEEVMSLNPFKPASYNSSTHEWTTPSCFQRISGKDRTAH